MINFGYDPTKERPEILLAESQGYEAVCGAGPGANVPDPVTIMPIDQQGMWPSCGGHMTEYMLEWVAYLATGKHQQLSRMFAWVEAQRMQGRPSQNDGVSIYACVKVLKELGLPREELAPYKVGNWYTQFSPESYTDAKTRLVLHSYRLETPEKVVDFAKAGMGAIGCGVPWEGGMRSWHALAILAPFEDGVKGPNSWPLSADKYGARDGWFEWDLDKLRWYMKFSGSVFYGVSDLETPQVREFDWRGGILS